MQQLPLAISLRASATFASYVAGPNRQVVQLLERLAPQPHAAPIWLHGPAGTGRTHLLQAVCARAGDEQWRATYLPMNELASFGPEVLGGAEWLEIVCVDDVESILGEPPFERALFALLVELQEHSGRLLIAAAQPPQALAITLPDLASRLAGGTVLRLRSLGEREQLEALRRRAAQRGLELPEDVALYMQRRLPRDTASLCAVVDALDEASLVAGRRLTLPFVRSRLEGG